MYKTGSRGLLDQLCLKAGQLQLCKWTSRLGGYFTSVHQQMSNTAQRNVIIGGFMIFLTFQSSFYYPEVMDKSLPKTAAQLSFLAIRQRQMPAQGVFFGSGLNDPRVIVREDSFVQPQVITIQLRQIVLRAPGIENKDNYIKPY